jgi:CelD/BcsL family acetyltransferase involved in cellulose biosynthesis
VVSNLSFDVVSTSEALKALEAAWRDLNPRADNDLIFQTFNWFWSGWECVASKRGRKLLLIVGRTEERIVLIWPLATYKSALWTVVQGLDSETTEYRDIVVEKSARCHDWVAQAWQFVTKKCSLDAIYLQYVPVGGPLGAQIQNAACVAAVVDLHSVGWVC